MYQTEQLICFSGTLLSIQSSQLTLKREKKIFDKRLKCFELIYVTIPFAGKSPLIFAKTITYILKQSFFKIMEKRYKVNYFGILVSSEVKNFKD